ncbi:MAG: lipopolysaccharide heptosyltransferase II [Acidaminococcaceae bacterium]|nr:lipopolysaccharide heptosyltransferase II [Acidaminococcaceae bacterium]
MDYKNILLIKMSSLGDVIHTLPFVSELRKLYPDAKITWLVHPQFGGFIPMQIVDEVIFFDKIGFNKDSFCDKIKDFLQMRKQLHSHKFDLVIDLQGLFKSAVLAAISGCNNRIGYCEMREGSQFVSKPIKGEHRHDHVIERYLDVARYLGAKVESVDFPLPDLQEEENFVLQKLASKGCESKYVVIVPGTRWETKCWPENYYADLIKRIIADGKYVILAGGNEDVAKSARIVEMVQDKKVINLAGQTTLKELIALIKNCCVYISADTGPLHFAAALKKPLVCMYGPTKADRTGPYGNPNQSVIYSKAKCAGCLKKHCTDWHCMYDITVDEVYNAYYEKLV